MIGPKRPAFRLPALTGFRYPETSIDSRAATLFASGPAIVGLLSALFLATAGCGLESGGASDELTDVLEQPLILEGAVQVLGSGSWGTIAGCSAYCAYDNNFWVDLAAADESDHREVGILWTLDGWQTHQVAWAHHEGALDEGYSRYGVDVRSAGFYGGPNARPEIEFAAFARMNGWEHWDRYNNYHVEQMVTRNSPLRLIEARVGVDTETGVYLAGQVRVLDLAYEKRVTIRYTLDGWQTFEDVDALYDDDQRFGFHIPALGSDVLPQEVQFAIRYEVGGETYWDSAGGLNHRLQIAPTFAPTEGNGYEATPSEGELDGILRFGGHFVTDLPMESTSIRVDEQPWVSADRLVFSTLEMGNGPHQVELLLTLEGGLSASATVPFMVRHQVQPQQVWAPTGLDTYENTQALTFDSQGRLWVATDRGSILRYEHLGQEQAPTYIGQIPSENASGLSELSVDSQGRVYAIISHWAEVRLYRLDSSGQLDLSFGNGGSVDLRNLYDGEFPVCPGDSLLVQGQLYLADGCQPRLIAFGPDGHTQSAHWYGQAGPSVQTRPRMAFGANSIWLLNDSGGDSSRWTGSLLQLSVEAETLGEFRVEDHASLAGLAISRPQGLTYGEGHLFFGEGHGRVVQLSAEGVIEGAFWGGSELSGYYSPDLEFFGGLRTIRDVVQAPGGEALVLTYQPTYTTFASIR